MPTDTDSIDRLRAALSALHATATDLWSQDGWPPTRLRIRVGDVSLEVDWAPDDHDGAADPRSSASNDGMVGSASHLLAQDGDDGAHGNGRAAVDPASAGARLTAPVAGTFYRAPEPGAPPFVDVGDVVQVGDQVAIVEAMKLMIPVKADHPGRVTAILKDDGDPVDLGDPLLVLADADG